MFWRALPLAIEIIYLVFGTLPEWEENYLLEAHHVARLLKSFAPPLCFKNKGLRFANQTGSKCVCVCVLWFCLLMILLVASIPRKRLFSATKQNTYVATQIRKMSTTANSEQHHSSPFTSCQYGRQTHLAEISSMHDA